MGRLAPQTGRHEKSKMWSVLLRGRAGSKAVSVSSESQWPSVSVNAFQPKTTRSTPGVEQVELIALCHESKPKGDSGAVEVSLFVAMNKNTNLINPRPVLVALDWRALTVHEVRESTFGLLPFTNRATSGRSLKLSDTQFAYLEIVPRNSIYVFWLLSDLEVKFV